jgi:hypothetical protein
VRERERGRKEGRKVEKEEGRKEVKEESEGREGRKREH